MTIQVSLLLVVITLSLEPIRTTLWLGQINVILLVLVLADHLAWRAGHPGSTWRAGPTGRAHLLAGLGSGLAAGIKLTPAFFWAYWILTGRWRMALTALAGFAATVLVGVVVVPGDTIRYWSGTLFDSQRIGMDSVVSNQSLRGSIARLGGVDMAPTWAWLVGAALVAGIGLGVAVLAHRAGHQLLGLTLAGMTMTMVSPFTWGHHWVWLVPLLVLAVHYAMAGPRWFLWLLPLAVWAAAANWVQSFPNGDFPDDRWVGMGLFMLGGDIPPLLFDLFTNVYPLIWLATVAATALLVTAGRPRTDSLGDHGTADDTTSRTEGADRG